MSMTRMATFDLAGVDDEESAWNRFVDDLKERGLRPADVPTRWTETSMTFRVFRLDHEEIEYTLDFDIAKIGKIATALVAASLLAATTADRWQTFLGVFGGLPA